MEVKLNTLYCIVTNDLVTDQRMQRICGSLARAGYRVSLLGRRLKDSKEIHLQGIRTIRLRLCFKSGKLFYLEYNWRIFWHLLFRSWDAVCAVDLDTVPGAFAAAWLRGKKRVLDAHEYYTEVPELIGRPLSKAVWEWVGRVFVPLSQARYTVGPVLAGVLSEKYGRPFTTIRNLPRRQREEIPAKQPAAPYVLLYQGVLNEGRGLEAMVEAMPMLPDCELWLAGEGVVRPGLEHAARQHGLADRVKFLGKLKPEELHRITPQAFLGMNLLDGASLNYYYSLANKFYDYVQASVPVLNMNFPEYAEAARQYQTGPLLERLDPALIADTVRQLIADPGRYARYAGQCRLAARAWHWEAEEQQLLAIYEALFKGGRS